MELWWFNKKWEPIRLLSKQEIRLFGAGTIRMLPDGKRCYAAYKPTFEDMYRMWTSSSREWDYFPSTSSTSTPARWTTSTDTQWRY